ncbi:MULTISPECIES: inositol monophosphatase family protein [Haloprofundus]|uniref:inositol monophosphatase family protein n=1 Tax=Haloprofundus TaxID=1911573 RepID=UPI000E42DE2E|nr:MULTISPECIES: inositol monophosphatase [Haloprofundus]QCJ48203.1 inositol monophosphatase [Haloprofundus sp. MHR1]
MDDLEVRERLVVDVAHEGGELALDSFRQELAVETKAGPLDAVTAVDRDVQRHIVERISERFPEDDIVGEEDDAAKRVPEDGVAWVIDPIDGTNNYVAGDRRWATSVALVEDGEPRAAVNYLPALGERYVATGDEARRDGDPVGVSGASDSETLVIDPIFGLSRPERRALARVAEKIVTEFGDLRRVGSGQTTLSMVASGELDAAVSTVELSPWDTIAGVFLVRQAGGVVTDPSGDPWRHDSEGLIASNGAAHDELVDAFGALGKV